jgi:serine/threonine protein kinase
MSDTREIAEGDVLRRALALLPEAFDHEGAGFEAWLQQACAGDAELLAELRRLLAADAACKGPLDRPLLAQLTPLDDTADSRLGLSFGPYVLRERLGRGGMGDVYRAERESGGFVQQVALKLLRVALRDDASALRRFRQERQILVRLQHPQIARLLDGGISADGQPWFAMELVEGEPLNRWAERLDADPARSIAVLMQVCEAVQYAHQNLVLHRDLKPANILVDAQGRVRLLDFGIAKLLLDDTESGANAAGAPTQTEHAAFTPDYAAPEQLLSQPVSTATDVYALGVIAYELLCRQRPFPRAQNVGRDDRSLRLPEPPSQRLAHSAGADRRRVAALQGDLDTIVLTCLQPEPQRRYVSVAALRADLERYLQGRPIEARPDTLGYRFSKFVRRHRLMVVAGAAAVLVLLATTAFSLRQMQRAEHASELAIANAAAFERERDAALGEVRRQDILREHFVAVIDRASSSAEPITPERLIDLAANQNLLGEFGDAEMQRSLQLVLAELLIHRGDLPRALAQLDQIDAGPGARPSREQALVAIARAQALVPLGRLEEADAAIVRAQAVMTPEQRDDRILLAQLAILRGQLARARGDLVAGAQAAEEAAGLAHAAIEGSALQRGVIIGGAATALLQLGDLDGALRHADSADAIWSAAGVVSNVSMRTVATVRSNVLFMRGDLLEALETMHANNAAADAAESRLARAARDATEAKTLAFLARPQAALALAERAVRGMCGGLGEASLDCMRARLSALDTRILAGDFVLATAEVASLRQALSAHASPGLNQTLESFASRLSLLQQPSAERLQPFVAGLQAAAVQGSMARLNATRSLLVTAQRLQAEHPELARGSARAALDLNVETAANDDVAGMDAALLAVWRAQLDSMPPPAAAIASLRAALGADHPWLQAPDSP